MTEMNVNTAVQITVPTPDGGNSSAVFSTTAPRDEGIHVLK